MLWFGNLLENSLINPNQIRNFGIEVNDNPYSDEDFGIIFESTFIPFDVMGTMVYFESRIPTECEEKHSPVILLTAEVWDPPRVQMGNRRTAEGMAMASIQSFASGRMKAGVSAISSQAGMVGETNSVLLGISPALDQREFFKRLINAVRVASHDRTVEDAEEEQRKVPGVLSRERHSKITAEELSRKWIIGLKKAEATMNCTTQRGVQTVTRLLSRRVRVDHLDLHRKLTVANVFTNGKFTKVVPLEARPFAGDSLVRFFDNVGVPELMVTDGAAEFTSKQKELGKHARRMRMRLHVTEQGRSNQNHAAKR